MPIITYKNKYGQIISGFYNFSIIDTLAQMIFCCGDYPIHCQLILGQPKIYLDIVKYDFGNGGAKLPKLRATGVD